jgi:hypothetical protein
MYSELERIWKVEEIAYFNILYRLLPGRSRENNENP